MNAGMMKGLGFADGDGALSVRVRLRSGKTVDRTLLPRVASTGFEWQFRGEMFGMPFDTPADWISPYKGLTAEAFRTVDYSRPPHLYQRRAYLSHALPEKKAHYIQLNQVDSTNFVSFIKSALLEIDVEKPQRLIIDLRFNFGGDGSRVVDMVHEFIKREDHPPWRELYVLTGRKTFSAGVMVLDQFIKHTDATLIGEPAGAALNSFGDAITRKYTRAGLSLHVSTLRHQLGESNDIREFIGVDVPAPFSFSDYVNGRDPAVDPILRGDEMRAIVQIALAAGGGAARKAYLSRKERFAGDPSWAPPSESELRNACHRLQAEKRLEDAVETCRLSTEIHPDVWNAWYGLANALSAAGRRQESVENYACVLKIDPLNWNQREIERILAEFHANPAKVPGGCGGGL
jgi:hypothetical protein